jgi:hypothetical protein
MLMLVVNFKVAIPWWQCVCVRACVGQSRRVNRHYSVGTREREKICVLWLDLYSYWSRCHGVGG